MSKRRHNIGDGPIQPEFHDLMNNVAKGLDEIFNGKAKGVNRKAGFVLLVFQMNDTRQKRRCNYISNANRDDIVTMLKEQIARFEGMAEPPTGHA